MNTRTVASLVALSASLAIGGCVPPRALAKDVVTAAVLEIAHSSPRVVVVREEAPTIWLAPDPPVSTLPAEALPPSGFDPVEGRAAADVVDISACWPAGTMHGYGSARVTFNPSGTVGLVEVVSPEKGSTPDQGCVAQKYGAVKLPEFRGPAVTLRTTFFVG